MLDSLTAKNFIQDSNRDFLLIEKLLKKVETDFEILVAFWGEDPKTSKPEEFFQVFLEFINAFQVKIFPWFITNVQKCLEENQRKREMEEKAARRAAEKEKRVSNLKSETDSLAENDER